MESIFYNLLGGLLASFLGIIAWSDYQEIKDAIETNICTYMLGNMIYEALTTDEFTRLREMSKSNNKFFTEEFFKRVINLSVNINKTCEKRNWKIGASVKNQILNAEKMLTYLERSRVQYEHEHLETYVSRLEEVLNTIGKLNAVQISFLRKQTMPLKLGLYEYIAYKLMKITSEKIDLRSIFPNEMGFNSKGEWIQKT